MHIFSSSIKVLLIYYDHELALYATLPLEVEVNEVVLDAAVVKVDPQINTRIKSFVDWQKNNLFLL